MEDLRRKLGIGKFSDFKCYITIVDVMNIPMASGACKVKWHFKSVHNALDDSPVEQSPANGSPTPKTEENRQSSETHDSKHALAHPLKAVAAVLHHHRDNSREGSPTPAQLVQAEAEGRPMSPDHSTPASPSGGSALGLQRTLSHTANELRGRRLSFGTSSTPPQSPSTPSRRAMSPTQSNGQNLLGLSSSALHASGSHERPSTEPAPPQRTHSKSEGKGTTQNVAVKNNVANFHRAVFCKVSMAVSKNGTLEPAPLKFKVRYTSHTTHGKAEEIQLGTREIDLRDFIKDYAKEAPGGKNGKTPAEMVALRASTRTLKMSTTSSSAKPLRFLLEDGKTNALLRLHIEVEPHTPEAINYRQIKTESASSQNVSRPFASATPTSSSSSSSLVSFPSSNSIAAQDASPTSHSRQGNGTSVPQKQQLRLPAPTSHGITAFSGELSQAEASQVVEEIFNWVLPEPEPLRNDDFVSVHETQSMLGGKSGKNTSPTRSFLQLPSSRPGSVKSSRSTSNFFKRLSSKSDISKLADGRDKGRVASLRSFQ